VALRVLVGGGAYFNLSDNDVGGMVLEFKSFIISEQLTVEEAAGILHVHPQTIRRHKDELKTVVVGDDYRIDSMDLLNRIRKGKVW
jgi:hypothetical protein